VFLPFLSGIQSACAILYCHLWPVRFYSAFPHYLTKGVVSGKKVTEHKMSVVVFSTTFAWNTSHLRRNGRDMDKNVHMSLCKVPVILFRFKEMKIPRQIFGIIRIYQLPCKIRQVAAKLFHAGGWMEWRTDRQTDMTNLIVAFRYWANAPKNLFVRTSTRTAFNNLFLSRCLDC